MDDADPPEVGAELIGSQYTNPKILVAAITTEREAIDHLTRFIGPGVLNRQIQVQPAATVARL